MIPSAPCGEIVIPTDSGLAEVSAISIGLGSIIFTAPISPKMTVEPPRLQSADSVGGVLEMPARSKCRAVLGGSPLRFRTGLALARRPEIYDVGHVKS